MNFLRAARCSDEVSKVDGQPGEGVRGRVCVSQTDTLRQTEPEVRA